MSSVGPFVERFEEAFAASVGARHAVACASGTAAIHLALLVLDVGPGDEVLVPTLTFVASANPVRYVGATPVFVDAEAETYNLDPALVVAELDRRARAGIRQPAAIEVVHLLGHPADMAPVLEAAERHGVPVVEDASEALGAAYRTGPFAGRQVGTIGRVGCFSFNGNKLITTGGGGMLVTDDEALAKRARHLSTQARLPGLAYDHDEVGFNYRLSNVSAALGLAQLEQLDALLAGRRANAARYDAAIRDLPALRPGAARGLGGLVVLAVHGGAGDRRRRADAGRGAGRARPGGDRRPADLAAAAPDPAVARRRADRRSRRGRHLRARLLPALDIQPRRRRPPPGHRGARRGRGVGASSGASVYPHAMSPDTRVAVVGLGYVGLPLAIAFAEAGLRVQGIDISADRVAQLNSRRSPIDDVSDERLTAALDNGSLCVIEQAEAGLADMDAIFVCVPTPITSTKDPDLEPVLAAAAFIRDQLHAGQLIILQSTTFPGTTTGAFKTVLEESGLVAGRDFDLAFAPERVNPGDPASAARTVPRLVGGSTPAATARAATLLEGINDRVVRLSSPDAAEMAKLLENTFRNVNIAFVNQLALLCERMGLDVWEVIDAAATKPFGFMRFTPGPGVGGHCIPLDPYYLSWRAREFDFTDRFIELAGDINFAMPRHVVELIAEALNDRGRAIRGSRVGILGVAFKPNVRDARNSPAAEVLALVAERGADVAYHDPHVPRVRGRRRHGAREPGPRRPARLGRRGRRRWWPIGRSTGTASTATAAWSSTPSTAPATARPGNARSCGWARAGRTAVEPAGTRIELRPASR